MKGIPENLQQEAAPPQQLPPLTSQPAQQTAQQPTSNAPVNLFDMAANAGRPAAQQRPVTGGGLENPLDAIRNLPEFQQVIILFIF